MAALPPGLPRIDSRVVVVHESDATSAFEPRADALRSMVNRAIVRMTGATNEPAAWRRLVNPQDVVGIKVYSMPGPRSGTRPAVVGAVIEGLLASGIPARNIVIWDKHLKDLQSAGFGVLAERYGASIAGSLESGFDENVFYDTPLIGTLVWGDLEFEKKGDGIGRKSFVSKLITTRITRIINIAPMLNHNSAAVTGCLFSLAMGSVDNTIRFETMRNRLVTAVPEIYALPALHDRVALNIVDALICQYEGEQRTMLHYAAVLNELRFGMDPVALDVLSVRELERQRKGGKIADTFKTPELYQNAATMDLGTAQYEDIATERVQ